MPEPGRPSRATILIADDAAHVRRLCALVLESRGFQVLEAEDGTEAISMYRHHRPDIVLLDIGMPGGVA
jgi:two-component system KDP operon response regulator KdpE